MFRQLHVVKEISGNGDWIHGGFQYQGILFGCKRNQPEPPGSLEAGQISKQTGGRWMRERKC